MTHATDPAPLDELDALDEERAADMLYNRPFYGPREPLGVPVLDAGRIDPHAVPRPTPDARRANLPAAIPAIETPAAPPGPAPLEECDLSGPPSPHTL